MPPFRKCTNCCGVGCTLAGDCCNSFPASMDINLPSSWSDNGSGVGAAIVAALNGQTIVVNQASGGQFAPVYCSTAQNSGNNIYGYSQTSLGTFTCASPNRLIDLWVGLYILCQTQRCTIRVIINTGYSPGGGSFEGSAWLFDLTNQNGGNDCAGDVTWEMPSSSTFNCDTPCALATYTPGSPITVTNH